MKEPTLSEKLRDARRLYGYYLLPILAIGSVLLLVFMVWVPQIKSITDSQKKLEEKTGTKDSLERKLTDLRNLDDAELTDMNYRIEYVLPSQKDPAWILAGISEIAADNKLAVSSIQTYPGPIATPSAATVSNLEFLKVIVNLTGPIEGIKNFVGTLSQSGRIYKVKELNIATGTRGQDINQPYSAEIDIKAFFQQYPEKIGKYEDPVPAISPSNKDVYKIISSDNFKIKGVNTPQSVQTVTPKVVEIPTPPTTVIITPQESTSSAQTATQSAQPTP